MAKLSESEITERLKNVDGWEYHENAIHTTFEFNDFKDAFSVMTRIAFEAEAQQHHPDWSNVYNKLQISLSTHDAGGITEKDFTLAKTIDAIIEGE
ncbi:4a-hydroxytetrahydrobiopterin dehydratase [Aquimarina muelleri]|uniref:Putative pterin-4-alpha-carbinolamine dehydratase n=1 Tax=Aquimarina muelleri TaxID=279356 RepID=A0A918JXU9_9FLAO|nr:4a-hydroxytetrahydrobiopterin dehydratase [Aquimarina muelleri]MCX2763283.1 4a-hydroxytetrahydrobiopterin dehydratase [Aquimarina muelleri]GGX26073.1 putative pterin-4-alpha-carbinolamine dehydratase [Aquimarina muelleri]